MNLNSSLDLLMSTVKVNTSSSSSGSTSGSSDFESLLQDKVNSAEATNSTSSEGNSTSESTSTENSQATDSQNSTTDTEIGDLERQLLAALNMQNMLVQPTEVTVDGELLVEEVELIMPELELDLETEVDMEAGMTLEFASELVEQVVETEGAIVLDNTVKTLETEVEIDIELPKEVEEVVEAEIEEVAELEEEQVVEVDTAIVETKVVSEETESKEEPVLVEGQTQGTRVFEKVEASTVKVGETVNADSPDFDNVMAKVISQADENGESTITILLTPENLGTVTIQLTKSSDGVLQIVMQAADSAAAKLLGSHADSIVAALHSNGTTVTVEVEAQEIPENRDDLDSDQNKENQGQEEKEKESEEEITISEDFMQQLRLGLVNLNPDLVDE